MIMMDCRSSIFSVLMVWVGEHHVYLPCKASPPSSPPPSPDHPLAPGADVAESAAGKIPTRVPRGYKLQIAIVFTTSEPEKGHFRRLGLDIIANATWLALKWALESEDETAEAALSALILEISNRLAEGSPICRCRVCAVC